MVTTLGVSTLIAIFTSHRYNLKGIDSLKFSSELSDFVKKFAVNSSSHNPNVLDNYNLFYKRSGRGGKVCLSSLQINLFSIHLIVTLISLGRNASSQLFDGTRRASRLFLRGNQQRERIGKCILRSTLFLE